MSVLEKVGLEGWRVYLKVSECGRVSGVVLEMSHSEMVHGAKAVR